MYCIFRLFIFCKVNHVLSGFSQFQQRKGTTNKMSQILDRPLNQSNTYAQIDPCEYIRIDSVPAEGVSTSTFFTKLHLSTLSHPRQIMKEGPNADIISLWSLSIIHLVNHLNEETSRFPCYYSYSQNSIHRSASIFCQYHLH